MTIITQKTVFYVTHMDNETQRHANKGAQQIAVPLGRRGTIKVAFT